MMERNRLNMRALSSVSGLAFLMVLSAPVSAAQETADDTKTVLDTVKVEGQRLANQRAIDAKRNADVIADVLASDDLNKLPDQNLAEGLARIPGLSTFQDEGAGLYVGVRGLSQEFVNVTVDGLEMSSASRTWDNNLRGANLEAVPSTFVRQVEVIKAVTPDLDGDAIAGTVNLITRSALDTGKSWLSLGLAGGQYEEDVPSDDVELSSKGNLSYGRTFLNDTVGLILDANFRNVNRDNLKPKAYWGGSADRSEMPTEIGGYFYEREERSWGATGKLELRPNDSVQGFVSANYFDSQTDLDKNKHAIYGASSDPTSGTFSGAVGTARNDHVEYGVDGSLTLSAGADFIINDRNTLSVQGSTSESKSYQDDPRIDWYNGGPLSGTYSYTGEHYVYTFDNASQSNWDDTSNYVFNGYRHFKEELEKGVDAIKLDWDYAPDGEYGLGYSAGAKYKETNVDYTATYFRWRNPKDNFDFGQFLRSETYRFPYTNNASIILSDIVGLSAFTEDLGADNFKKTDGYTNGQDYRIKEGVTSVYALADYSAEKFRIIGGLRYESTSTDAQNRFNRVDDADWVTTDGSYDNWLPSIAFTYFASDNLLLRLGASQTIGRPDVKDLARGETPPNDNGYYSRGNPDLKPRLSTNFDASVEYYFDNGDSLLSVALFRKDIADEIYDLQTPYIFTDATGAQIDSYYIQPDNGGDAQITGLEIGLIKDRLSFLPGPLANIGLSANMTFNSGDLDLLDDQRDVVRTVTPEGLSERLANATVYYEGAKFSARAAWRYASEQTQSLSIDGSADLLLDDYQQTDLQFGYKLNDQVEFFGEVWNVFEDEQTFTDQNLVGDSANWFEDVRYGRAVWFGVNFKR